MIGARTLLRPHAKRGPAEPGYGWAWAGCTFAAIWTPGASTYRDLVRGRGLSMAGAATTERHAERVVGPDMTGSTTGAYAVHTDQPYLRCAGAWTVASLFYSDGDSTGQSLLTKGANSESAGSNNNYHLGFNANTINDDQSGNGFIVFFERADSAGANVSAKWVTSNTAGTYLLMGVLDPAAQELRLYNDGQLQRTRTSMTWLAEASTTDLVIGRGASDADVTNRWNGVIHATWIWRNRAFTNADALGFARDPFGMFRERAIAYTAVAGTGARSFVAGMIG